MTRKRIIAPESKQKQIEVIQTIGIEEAFQEPKFRSARKNGYYSLSDELAESTVYFRNHRLKEADILYPDFTQLNYRFVTKYYPYAKGGPLFVDEVRGEYQTKIAYEKQKTLKKLGYRHIVIQENSTFYDCLEQLGEI